MRKFCTGLLAMALTVGLLAVEPAQAKVYKMAPEERAAALKAKKTNRAKAKKAGKSAPGQGQGGWVEVKPGEKVSKRTRKSKVDEIAQAAEQKSKRAKASKKNSAAGAEKTGKPEFARPDKADKKSKKSKKAAGEIVVEKKGKKPSPADKKTEKKTDKQVEKKSGRKSASRGDRLVGSDFTGERKVSASSTEVRRVGGAPAAAPASASGSASGPATVPGADDLSGYSVSRPGQGRTPATPELRHEVQPGPVDASKPLGTEHNAGEGRF